MFLGFQTASGKEVKISEDALKKAKALFDDFKLATETNPTETNEKPDTLQVDTEDKVLTPHRHVVQNVLESPKGLLSPKLPFDPNISSTPKPNLSLINKVSSPLAESPPKPVSVDDDIEENGEDESIQEEVTSSTFALLADEEEDESNRNALFGDSTPIPLQHISKKGGLVPLIHAYVLRLYPVMYMSRNEHGRNIFESEKTYLKNQKRREDERQSKLENLYSKVKQEILEEVKCNSNSTPRKSLKPSDFKNMDDEELLNVLENVGDESLISDHIPPTKLSRLKETKAKMAEAIRTRIQQTYENRAKETNISCPVPVLKVQLIDVNESEPSVENSMYLLIWRPDSELSSHLVERKAFEITKLSPRFHTVLFGLNSTRTTEIRPISISESMMFRLAKFERVFTPISSLSKPDFHALLGEIDTIGVVVQVNDLGLKMGCSIYISSGDGDILSIRFWKSLVEHGVTSEIQLGNVLVIRDLQWRSQPPNILIPCGYVEEVTSFMVDNRELHGNLELDKIRTNIKSIPEFVCNCQMKILDMLTKRDKVVHDDDSQSDAIRCNKRRRILPSTP